MAANLHIGISIIPELEGWALCIPIDTDMLQPVPVSFSRLSKPFPSALNRLRTALFHGIWNGRFGDIDAPFLQLSNVRN